MFESVQLRNEFGETHSTQFGRKFLQMRFVRQGVLLQKPFEETQTSAQGEEFHLQNLRQDFSTQGRLEQTQKKRVLCGRTRDRLRKTRHSPS